LDKRASHPCVSSAFLTEPARFWEIEPETWRIMIDTNVNGPFLMARNAAPVMVKAGWGRIVNVSMNRETMRRRGFSPYGPSKAALESETIIWSQDLAGTGAGVEVESRGQPLTYDFTMTMDENVTTCTELTTRVRKLLTPGLMADKFSGNFIKGAVPLRPN